jgi:hypothetical protein
MVSFVEARVPLTPVFDSTVRGPALDFITVLVR